MKEYFDIRHSAGNPTGEVKARSLVHRDGDIPVSYTHLDID